MLEQLQGFHIEPTNICTLKCSQCARTEFINKFPRKWKNKQLNLNDLTKFIDIDITDKIIGLGGNYGDPIYYDSLFDLIDWAKQKNGIIKISTNGSYKTKEWWNSLANNLTKKDVIVFGIDGIPTNFTNYRINADWNSILLGIEQVAKKVTTIWKYIPFSFNEDDIKEAEKMAKELGMEFFLDPTDRWSSESDPLKSNKFLGKRYNNIINWTPIKQIAIDPICKTTNYQHFISADGYYMPCCFVGDHRFYYSSEFHKNKKKYDISNSTISSVLESLTDYYNNIENVKPNYCTFNCPKYD